MLKSTMLFALALSTSLSVARAKSASIDPASFVVKISSADRNPASTCITTDTLNGLQAVAIVDYGTCNRSELSTIRSLLLRVIESLSPKLNDKSLKALETATSVAYMGAAKASLALVDAKISR